MSMPHSDCSRTTSLTACLLKLANACLSYGSPATCACISFNSGCGRARLPTCVVKMRSVLRCIYASTDCRRLLVVRQHTRDDTYWRRAEAAVEGGATRGERESRTPDRSARSACVAGVGRIRAFAHIPTLPKRRPPRVLQGSQSDFERAHAFSADGRGARLP